MAYLRFLTDLDYCSIATEEHMRQLVRDNPERVPQAEQRAEMQLLEYLDQYYEIEKVLAIGKNIREYSINVSYPGRVWIKKDGTIFKTLTSINGRKRPSTTQYWKHVDDFISPHLIENARKYSQLRMYFKGEVVRFGTEYWQCVTPHGFDGGEVHLPGERTWATVDVLEWEPNLEWERNQVCSFNGRFYQYVRATHLPDDDDEESDTVTDDSEEIRDSVVLNPEEDDLWGLIGEYSEDIEYDCSEGANDYVVHDGVVFCPILNPNPDQLVEGVNIVRDDPRNINVVAHMSRIALYHLHSIIAPTNVPETRRLAYEDSIQWLYNASKFKINPQLPRKTERGSCQPKVDWACETFQRDYNVNENPWMI